MFWLYRYAAERSTPPPARSPKRAAKVALLCPSSLITNTALTRQKYQKHLSIFTLLLFNYGDFIIFKIRTTRLHTHFFLIHVAHILSLGITCLVIFMNSYNYINIPKFCFNCSHFKTIMLRRFIPNNSLFIFLETKLKRVVIN